MVGPRGGLCEGDTTALVLDGANAICERSPTRFARATTSAAILAFVAVWMFAPLRWRRRALLIACSLSIPGFVAVACDRGDAPGRVAVAAAPIIRLETEVRRHAKAHGCAVVDRNDCEACQPIVRLALAHAGPCDSRATVSLGADALECGCASAGPRLICGGRP